MKKLIIAATLAATALGATSLLASPGHQHGPRQAGATENCAMTGNAAERGKEHSAQREQRHAQMQARMQEMHARMGSHEGRGNGRGMQGEHQH